MDSLINIVHSVSTQLMYHILNLGFLHADVFSWISRHEKYLSNCFPAVNKIWLHLMNQETFLDNSFAKKSIIGQPRKLKVIEIRYALQSPFSFTSNLNINSITLEQSHDCWSTRILCFIWSHDQTKYKMLVPK